jgi:hypothetical protein
MQKRKQNSVKRTQKPKTGLHISSFAFYRPALRITSKLKLEGGGQYREGHYLSPVGTVHFTAQDDKTAPGTFGRLDMNHAGREYRLFFADSPTERGLMLRARAFAQQVQLMAAAEVKALPLGAPVPTPAVVATVGEAERRQLPLFDAGSITRAEHFEEVQQILEHLLSRAKQGAPMVGPLSYALAANDALRVHYGITPPVATVTAGS